MNVHAVDFEAVQALADQCLAASPAFAALDRFIELGEDATPEQLAALDDSFEAALVTKGIAVMILSPQLTVLSQLEGRSVAGEATILIGICENPEVNRGAAAPAAKPPRAPAGISVRKLVPAAVSALLPRFTFPAQITGRPEWATGYIAHYVQASCKVMIRATGPAPA